MTVESNVANALQHFAVNTAGRDFAVGDIHGCFYMLDALLARIGFDERRDRLFSVGDLTDRGPDSERAGEFLDKDWFYCIRGNHEQMLLDAVHDGGQAEALWHMNGGGWFAELDRHAQQQLIEQVGRLPLALLVADADGSQTAIVHADVPSDDWASVAAALVSPARDAQLCNTLIWSRRRAQEITRRLEGTRASLCLAVDGIDRIVFGHTPMPAPVACANTRWLDTGAFMGRALSIAELGGDHDVWSLAADLEDCARGWRWLD